MVETLRAVAHRGPLNYLRPVTRVLLLALALALAAPAAAPAATVGFRTGDGDDFHDVEIKAAPGETNQLVFGFNGFDLVIEALAGPLAGDPDRLCHNRSASVVHCALSDRPLRIHADLGDGDDVFGGGSLRHWRGQPIGGTIDAGPGNDSLRQDVGGPVPDASGMVMRGGEGDDALSGGGVLEGGPGDDRIAGNSFYSFDRIDGGEGADRLNGGPGPDHVMGGPGNDLIVEGESYEGQGGADIARIDGGDGDDRIVGAGAESAIFGGAGNDDIESRAITADGGEGDDVLSGGPTLRGGAGNDSLTGSAAAWPRAGSGGTPDQLEGGEGNDSLTGGAVNAMLDGGPGADLFVAGPARDTVSFRSRAQVTLNLRGPGPISDEGDTTLGGIERYEGTDGDDELIAGSEPVALDGLKGRDTLTGGPAADVLDGGPHDDVIAGGGGNDRLLGGDDAFPDPANPRTRIRAPGFDTLDGGDGDDTIFPRGGEDFVTAGAGEDWIDARENAGPSFGRTALNHSHIIQMSGADQVWCEEGTDHVDADYADDIGLDCETASEGTPRWRSLKVRDGRPFRLTVRCAWAESRPCKGTASLRTATGEASRANGHVDQASVRAASAECRGAKPGTILTRARFRIRAGRVNYVYLELKGAGARLLRRRGCLAVHAVLRFDDAKRRPWQATRSLTLQRRPM
jgi:Ca2+-binding RTX toxin-like protein